MKTINKLIYVDSHSEPIYGSDQANVSYPCRFATVNLPLIATDELVHIADRIRKNFGFAPLYPMDEYAEDSCDNEGWYDFYIDLWDYGECKCSNAIEFVVVSSDSSDNENSYHIDLSEEERIAIYAHLNEQCKKCFGKGCEELLAEARGELDILS